MHKAAAEPGLDMLVKDSAVLDIGGFLDAAAVDPQPFITVERKTPSAGGCRCRLARELGRLCPRDFLLGFTVGFSVTIAVLG